MAVMNAVSAATIIFTATSMIRFLLIRYPFNSHRRYRRLRYRRQSKPFVLLVLLLQERVDVDELGLLQELTRA